MIIANPAHTIPNTRALKLLGVPINGTTVHIETASCLIRIQVTALK